MRIRHSSIRALMTFVIALALTTVAITAFANASAARSPNNHAVINHEGGQLAISTAPAALVINNTTEMAMTVHASAAVMNKGAPNGYQNSYVAVDSQKKMEACPALGHRTIAIGIHPTQSQKDSAHTAAWWRDWDQKQMTLSFS